jgi:hypothetical protein
MDCHPLQTDKIWCAAAIGVVMKSMWAGLLREHRYYRHRRVANIPTACLRISGLFASALANGQLKLPKAESIHSDGWPSFATKCLSTPIERAHNHCADQRNDNHQARRFSEIVVSGVASFTVSGRPIIDWPFGRRIASLTIDPSRRHTKPNPRGIPVARSRMICADSTGKPWDSTHS